MRAWQISLLGGSLDAQKTQQLIDKLQGREQSQPRGIRMERPENRSKRDHVKGGSYVELENGWRAYGRAGAGFRRIASGLGSVERRTCHARVARSAQRSGWRREQLSSYQRQLRSDPIFLGQADQHIECRQASSCLDLPDGGEGVDGDDADRRQWRHVCHHLIRPCLCPERQDWRGVLALQARHGSGHDLLLRTEQPWR